MFTLMTSGVYSAKEVVFILNGLKLELFIKFTEVDSIDLAPASLFNPLPTELDAYVNFMFALIMLELLWKLIHQLITVGKFEFKGLLCSFGV